MSVLTDTRIKLVKPTLKPYKLADGDGLHLARNPSRRTPLALPLPTRGAREHGVPGLLSGRRAEAGPPAS